ncbi:MAG: phage major capsid protein [Kiritimatiellae bacterium]|nr:phage major capsid protein [Kiritimatiellia bacterium]
MDTEIKKALDALRAELGKNVDAIAKIDAIEKAAGLRDADMKTIRAEIDTIKPIVTERETQIRELQQQVKVRTAELTPATRRQEHIAMLGMITRQLLARANGMEVPAAFRGEADQLKAYLARSQERAALEVGASPGSLLIPTTLDSMIYDAMEEISEIVGMLDMQTGLPAGNTTLSFFTSRPALKPKRANASTEMSESSFGISQVTVSPQEAYIFFGLDNNLFSMSPVALGMYAMQLLREGVLEGLAGWAINADGTASYNSDTGILNEATYVTAMASGSTTPAKLAVGDLRNLMKATLKRGRRNGIWLGGLGTLGLIQDLDRTGKIPCASIGPDGTERVFMRPWVSDEDMPEPGDIGADAALLGFGDLSTYLMAIAAGIQFATSADYKFGYNQTCFRATLNLDLVRKPVSTFRLLKTAAQ